MKSTVTIRFNSGREERYEVESLPHAEKEPEARLRMLTQSDVVTLQTDDELILIPRSAIEKISVAMPRDTLPNRELAGVRQARRLPG
jgi:hypothetical protein